MVQFAGKYVFDKSDNFEAFVQKMNMTADKQKLALDSKPEIDISVNGDAWTITTNHGQRTTVSSFKLNQVTEVEGGTEGKSQVIFKLDGNTLRQEGVESSSVLVLDRTFHDTGLTMVMKHKPSNTTAKRHFKRL